MTMKRTKEQNTRLRDTLVIAEKAISNAYEDQPMMGGNQASNQEAQIHLLELIDDLNKQLCFETVSVHTIDHRKFEGLVLKTYNRAYCFVSSHEARNDNTYEFIVDNKPLDRPSEKDIEGFESGTSVQVRAQNLLQDMVVRKIIPTGTWLIRVSW